MSASWNVEAGQAEDDAILPVVWLGGTPLHASCITSGQRKGEAVKVYVCVWKKEKSGCTLRWIWTVMCLCTVGSTCRRMSLLTPDRGDRHRRPLVWHREEQREETVFRRKFGARKQRRTEGGGVPLFDLLGAGCWVLGAAPYVVYGFLDERDIYRIGCVSRMLHNDEARRECLRSQFFFL
jgi:hypothetical protein